MKWKFLYLILWLAIETAGFSQSELSYNSLNLASSHPARQSLEDWLSTQYSITITLESFQQDSSINGHHQSFWIKYRDQKIQDAIVRYHQFNDGRARLSAPESIGSLPNAERPDWNAVIERWSKAHPRTEVLLAEERWLVKQNSLLPHLTIHYRSRGIQKEEVINPQGNRVIERTRSVFDKRDSTVFINAYLPDPITVLETTYGPVEDADDADHPALIEAMTRDTIAMRWNAVDETWLLQSDYARAADFYSAWESTNPNIDPPRFSAPQPNDLEVTRSKQSFEYYNAFYHITRYQEHLQQLGFENLVNYPIAFDAHASLRDQSSFEPLGENSRLRFGNGGVDDAEDADVIIHEYGHAITNSAAPETNFGGERAALDEGFCDYIAISYSRRLSAYQRNLVFNWDGHNSFWDGRTLDDTRSYPSDKTFDIYADGILWASALAEVSDIIGLDVTDRILIHSVYEWYPNMLLSDAARLFLRSDSLLNDGANSELASIILCDRGFLPGCEDTLISSLPFSEPYVGNTEDFAFNNEPLYIFPNGLDISSFEVIDLQGRTLYEEKWTESEALFYPYEGSTLRQGSYILRLHTEEGSFTFKIIRTWL